MKAGLKHLKVIASLILLVTALLCVINASFSYFTSTPQKSEEMSFTDLNVRFVYRNYNDQNAPGGINQIEGDVLQLYPVDGTIERETPFEFSLTDGGDPIAALAIQNPSGSCDCYVRFWIDAYIVKKDGSLDKTTNYGKYFVLTDTVSVTIPVTKGTVDNNSAGAEDCYYLNTALTAQDGIARNIGNKLTLTDARTENVPVEILGESLRIFISLEAVQSKHQAFKQAFNDAQRGYLNSWT